MYLASTIFAIRSNHWQQSFTKQRREKFGPDNFKSSVTSQSRVASLEALSSSQVSNYFSFCKVES
jgi:hypothetical protein